MNTNSNGFSGARRIIMKTAAVLTAFIITAFNYGGAMSYIRSAPDAVYAENENALKEKLSYAFAEDGFSITAESAGDDKLSPRSVALKLCGLITLRRIPVYVSERIVLVPGGQAVGISIYTDGVLIVGISGFRSQNGQTVSPAQKAGLKAGDTILSVNGTAVSSADELKQALISEKGKVRLLVERSGARFETELVPETSDSGEPRIGAWVRDSTVGVGTLSFFDPESQCFAALGHPVTDADTGSLLRVKDGKLVLAQIIGVSKGRPGAPGELHGVFDGSSPQIGEIVSNTDLGIFGKLIDVTSEYFGNNAIETAFPDEVHTGDAFLLCSADGTLKGYSCRIIKTGKQNEPAPKGLVIEITDAELKELTGGIVQGMSGSPVIQDGRLVGVITHVLVNDPAKGYGAYAYWMIKTNGG